MSFKGNKLLHILHFIFLISLIFANTLSAQKIKPERENSIPKKFNLRQDTVAELKKRSIIAAEPDTNFTWEKYASFLNKVSDTSKYIVLPLNEFRQTFNNNKIVIGLRHDVDNDLNVAYNFSEIESKLKFRSTYFILHSAPYYLANPNNMEIHSEAILPIIKKMQDERNFEIGWHNDLVTLQVIYNINPVKFLHNELNWLRSNGINISGTAAHGSGYCKTLHYMNFYFFEECTFPVVPNRENNLTVPKDGKSIMLLKGKLSDFDLKYEAYFLNNNKAFSDAVITNGIRWNIGMLNLSQLQPGDRAIILLHPIHWHKASVRAQIESFSIPGQKSCTIDTVNSIITVEMLHDTNRSSLVASYALSPGAYAKVSGKLQYNRSSSNDFNNPVIYKVYAENRDVQKEWTIIVHNTKSQANFISFSVPEMKGQPVIDTVHNTIKAVIIAGHSRDSLIPSFCISDGSHVWIGKQEQISDINSINFSSPVIYHVVSKDSQIIKKWKVTVVVERNPKSEKPGNTGLLIYPNPSEGKTYFQFEGVKTSPSTFDIFNAMGAKVFTEKIKKTGDFTIEEDLKELGHGTFIVRYSGLAKSEIIVLKNTR
jgi:hypothetical protein